ncbi:hypothetical protein [Rhodococcus kronopolitis]|uniref:hypothetical protein n=1 Tax=Rhodococcus kronopolitis TaxID=1460226 RepID=UPI003A982F40
MRTASAAAWFGAIAVLPSGRYTSTLPVLLPADEPVPRPVKSAPPVPRRGAAAVRVVDSTGAGAPENPG